jgi:Tfp pilus assembly PilM family ATPase
MTERKIGLHVQDRVLRAVEVERKRGLLTLTALGEYRIGQTMPSPVESSSATERNAFVSEFTDGLRHILKSLRFRSTEISLAIDIRNAFIHTVPFNGDYDEENIKSIIRWELANYFPGYEGTSFIYDAYNPGYNPSRDISPEFIFTAVFKSYIHLLQEGIRQLNLHLHSINVDQFAIENVLKLENTDTRLERLIAVCFYYDSILFSSLLWNNRLIKYSEDTVSQISELYQTINKFLMSSVPPAKNTLKKVYLFPRPSEPGNFRAILPNWEVDHIAPFTHLKKSRRARKILDHLTHTDDEYAAAVGAAIHGG